MVLDAWFAENFVDGCAFVMLSQRDIRQLVPPIGLAKKVFSLVPKVIHLISLTLCWYNCVDVSIFHKL